jgi:hypothetical protein
VVLLPLSSYRQPRWNDGRKVLDPVGRFLTRDFVASDDLFVSGKRVAGEDPRARDAARALAAPSPEARAAGLAELGIRFVVTDKDAGPAPAVAGRTLLSGTYLEVQELAESSESTVPTAWTGAMAAAWSGFVGLVLAGLAGVVIRGRRGASSEPSAGAHK